MKLERFAALAAFAAVASFGSFAAAQPFPVVDGTVDAYYGDPIAVQTVETEFGDTNGVDEFGSELDAAYVSVCGGRLYMIITGNVEQNFNKLEIFFDTKTGGENVLSALPEYDFDDGTAWISTYLGGQKFDAGFEADYHMFVRSGGGDNYEVDWIDRLGGTGTAVNGNSGAAVGLGTVAVSSVANNAVATALANDISFFFDNSNTAGVVGGTAAADQVAAAAVTTGFEFSIDFADLGLDPTVGNTIRVAAIMGNSNHNYNSNQTLEGLPAPQGNLGGDNAGGFTGTLSGVDFTAFAGDQFMTISLPAKGDADGDGKVDFVDVSPFLLALFDRPQYDIDFPNVDPTVLDINCDGVLDFVDVTPFLGILFP